MPSVGADVESICRKCGDVWHVVVAKVGESIAKVQCKECGSLHKHRPPGGVAKKTSTVTRRSSSAAKTSRARKEAALPAEPMVEPDLSKPIRPYSIRETFAVGERIDHPKFGIGIIENAGEVGKIQVHFPDGRRVLAQAKPASQLSAPKRPRPAWQQE